MVYLWVAEMSYEPWMVRRQ